MDKNRRTSLKKDFPHRGNERGIALPTSLLALLLMTLLGLSLTTIGIISTNVTTNDRVSTESFYIAEAGIAHAKAILENDGNTNLDSLLQAEDGTPCNGDELSGTPSSPLTAGDAITSAASGGHTFGAGRYEVSICDDHAFESSPQTHPIFPTAIRLMTRMGWSVFIRLASDPTGPPQRLK